MFNLDQAIAEWRRKLEDAGVSAPVILDELESHLRDQIDALLKSGIDERQAFEAAVERIGPVETLRREFTREQRLKNAFLVAAMGLYSLVAGVPVLFKLGSFSDINSAQQRSAFLAVLITVVALFGGRLFGRILPVVSNLSLRVMGGVWLPSLLVWWAIFYHHVMTRVEWNMSQLVVAILWALMPPMTLTGGILLGMEDSAAAQRPKTYV